MKLGPEHIGRRVRRNCWYPTVWIVPSSIKGPEVIGVDEMAEDYREFCGLDDDWLILDEEPIGFVNGKWSGTPETNPLGLSLLDAVRSGKEFKAIGSTNEQWLEYIDGRLYCGKIELTLSNLENWLSAHYELKPESKKVEITKDQILNSLKSFMKKNKYSNSVLHSFADYLIGDLGLND